MLALLIASVVAQLSRSPTFSSWAFIMRSGLKLALAAAILVWTGRVEPALSEPADFYKGKDIKLIISATVGGGYDVYARALAKHLGEHIPGNPTIIPQNLPAAGGIAAANHMYNVAPRDGTVICLLQNTVAFEPFYANRQAQYDAAKFSWLGTPTTEVAMYIVWHASKIKTLSDAQTQEMMTGGAGAASTPAFYGRVFNQLFNMKARLITGYPGQNEILLALENGEVEAMASPFWSSIKTMRPDWYPQSKIRVLFQYGSEPHPELEGVPFALDLLQNDTDKALLIAASAPLGLGRPFMAPPDIPADRLAALRAAMMATFNDPQFRADCQKQRLECSNPKSGEEIEALIKQAYATPEAIRKRLIDIYQVGLNAEKK
jgi:tripartite-type tricarboxylate transporter receptor subunit TctC